MTAMEFQTRVEENAGITIPPEIASRLSQGQSVRVLILFDDPVSGEAEEKAWRRMTQEYFFKGYAESDGIYDNYDQLHGR